MRIQGLLVFCASRWPYLVRSLSSVLSVATASSSLGLGLGYQLVAPVHKNYICKQWEKASG